MKTIPLKFNKEKVIIFLQKYADGHSILDSDYFTKDLGFSTKQIKPVIKRHISNPSVFKETIFMDEKIMEETKGIYCLDFLYWLGKKLGVATDNPFHGRGLQSKFLCEQILKVLEVN